MQNPRSSWLARAALAVALFSLVLNGWLLWQLRHPERWAVPALQRTVRSLAARDVSFRYEVRLPAGTPLSLDLPLNERFTVRVDTVIPIDTRVRVPLRSPLGSYTVRVPFQANIPIRATIPLDIRHTFRLRTRTTEEIVIPLQIRTRDLPVDGVLPPQR